jgi:hypothetical protein
MTSSEPDDAWPGWKLRGVIIVLAVVLSVLAVVLSVLTMASAANPLPEHPDHLQDGLLDPGRCLVRRAECLVRRDPAGLLPRTNTRTSAHTIKTAAVTG